MIELKHLGKIYSSASGSVEALKDVNLTIADGEIFGIIGLSGAGKSTLVRCINLLERPTSGEVLVDGQNIMALSQKELLQVRRQIGMIFQGFNLLEQRTVLLKKREMGRLRQVRENLPEAENAVTAGPCRRGYPRPSGHGSFST